MPETMVEDGGTYDNLSEMFFEANRPTTPPPHPPAEYITKSNKRLKLTLVKKNPLWGHLVYPSARILSRYLEDNADTLVKGKKVLELGAGAGLPGLVAAELGAEEVLITDYPDLELTENIEANVQANFSSSPSVRDRIGVQGYLWGKKLPPSLNSPLRSYDLILMCDLIFNHSEHLALLKTCADALSNNPRGIAFCFYAHHRTEPHFIARDNKFIELAKEQGWNCELILKDTEAGLAFPHEVGGEDLRKTVWGYRMIPPSNLPLHKFELA